MWPEIKWVSWMEMMRVVAVAALYKQSSITQTLCKDLTPNIKQVHSLAYVSTNIFNGRIAVDVGQQTQTESISIHAWVSIAINDNMRLRGMKGFTNSLIKLVVSDGTPIWWLLVLDLNISSIRSGADSSRVV